MQFWHNNITEKSWQTLQDLKGKFDFVLIGGWAVYLYTKKMRSKDIDIVINYEVLGKLKEKYQVIKNDRLKKYEINLGEFDVDIYLPFYSQIGFPLEKIKKYVRNLKGFNLPQIEILLCLKLFAYSDRKNSLKGEKDKIDIISLLGSIVIDWSFLKQLNDEYDKIDLIQDVKEILVSTDQVKELNLGHQALSKLRKNILSEL